MVVKTMAVLLAACMLVSASAKIVMIGDSFSDNGHGANPVVMDALSTSQVRARFVVAREQTVHLHVHA